MTEKCGTFIEVINFPYRVSAWAYEGFWIHDGCMATQVWNEQAGLGIYIITFNFILGLWASGPALLVSFSLYLPLCTPVFISLALILHADD